MWHELRRMLMTPFKLPMNCLYVMTKYRHILIETENTYIEATDAKESIWRPAFIQWRNTIRCTAKIVGVLKVCCEFLCFLFLGFIFIALSILYSLRKTGRVPVFFTEAIFWWKFMYNIRGRRSDSSTIGIAHFSLCVYEGTLIIDGRLLCFIAAVFNYINKSVVVNHLLVFETNEGVITINFIRTGCTTTTTY